MTTPSHPTLHSVHLDECPPQPWRNGGGVTRELLLWPVSSAPAETQDWTLRVSVADVSHDGPFSSFPGVQRWFAVLEGSGVTLALPGGDCRLRRGDAPVHFAGVDAPGCKLIAGATRDLNLMVRHGTGRMWKVQVDEPTEPRTRWRALYAATALRVQTQASHAEVLEAGTLLWSDSADTGPWTVRDQALAYWMSVSR